jgi:queuine tRNA-ribosyltransferase
MPVGTQGTVKAVEQRELVELNAQIILGNTYHLYLRPGSEVISHFQGLHKFINWQRPILTDSGGYQVFSLSGTRKLTEDGALFKSHIDGSSHLFTPESVVDFQRVLGSDIMMVLDECVDYPSERKYVEKSVELSKKWAKRAFDRFNNSQHNYNHRQFHFAIGQGGMYEDLRKDYCQWMTQFDFDGFAIGGLSVGEPAEIMYEMTNYCTDNLPENKPRYLMGVGTPENILNSIELGVDMFDCVMPTRNARNGQIFTSKGKLNIRNAKYKLSNQSVDDEVSSYTSDNFTLGYLRHLFIADEILAYQLASIHNIAFYLWLTKTAREKILNGNFVSWKQEFLNKYNSSK